MALIKNGPNQWRISVSVRVPGKKYPVSKTETFTGSKFEAEARRAEIFNALKNGAPCSLKAPLIQFKHLLEKYHDKKAPFSKSHEILYRIAYRELGEISLSFFPEQFEAYLKNLRDSVTVHGKKRKAASYNRIISVVKAAFRLAKELEIVDYDPITKARFQKQEEKPRDRYLTDEERLRLFNAIREQRPYILPIIEYSIAVPCRKMELVTAKREQYNAFTNTVYIPDSKADIPIHKPVPATMVDYFRSIPADCPYLFYRQDKKGYHSLGDFKKAWKYCLKKAGLSNVHVHDLRHVAASDLYAAGVSERMIMDVAGWKTPMLSTYRHRDSLKSAQAINLLSQKIDTLRTSSYAVN